MALEIQVPLEVGAWRQRVVLDGQAYFLTVQYNLRTDRYSFSMADANQDPVVEGRTILCRRNLLRRTSKFNGPPGVLMALDWSGQHKPPMSTNFGREVTLIYIPEDEL